MDNAVDPTTLYDPAQTQKLAENVLTQLGLHPNQQNARSLLDQHFQTPHAADEVKKIVAPMVNTQVGTEPTPAAAPIQNQPQEALNNLPEKPVGQKTSAPPINIPPPSIQSPIISSANDTVQKHQKELNRLVDTGSGISQIKNPWLRGLATAGDIGESIFSPGAAMMTPGTYLHHEQLIKNEQGDIKNAQAQAENQAKTEHLEEETQALKESGGMKPGELSTWMHQHPGEPIENFWKAKALERGGKLTPQEEAMRYLTTPVEQGGLGQDPETAFKRLQGDIAEGKPETAAQIESKMMGLLQKTFTGGQMDPRIMQDPKALVGQISGTPNLTDDEKSQLFSYMAMKPTPAAQGGQTEMRVQGLLNRLYQGIDINTQTPAWITPAQHNANLEAGKPDTVLPAGPTEKAMSQAARLNDIQFNITNLTDAIKNLHNGFDVPTRAAIAFLLREPDPKAALGPFLNSQVGQNLQPDQIDLLTSMVAMQENAMMMRSIQSLGAGSDLLRGAIIKMIPGPGTPTPEYAQRQINLLQGTMERIREGIPKTGIPGLDSPVFKPTEHTKARPGQQPVVEQNQGGGTNKGEFTRQQVQKIVDDYNTQHPDDKTTIEEEIKNLKSAGYKLKEEGNAGKP